MTIKTVPMDDGVFIDMSKGMLDAAELRMSMNRAPRGYILPDGAPETIEDELVSLGFDIRRPSPTNH